MYYYLRSIATMFMERETVAAAPTPGTIPTTPRVPTTPRRGTVSTAAASATGGLSSTGAATAVAARPTTATSLPKTPVPVEATAANAETSELSWISWTGIVIAAIGTLAMGTILPFWLINLAQQAATMMLK
jgi:NADH-quinone oxidoreductase subunit N